MYFVPYIIFNIEYFVSVRWSRNFCSISMYIFFVLNVPEDGHMSDRNM